MICGSGRFKHEPNEAVERFKGGVKREEQGGEEGGQGEAEGDDNGDNEDNGKGSLAVRKVQFF